MSQQKSPHEGTILFVVVIGLVTGISLVIWHNFQTELTNLVRWVRWTELWLVKLIYGGDHMTQSSAGPFTLDQWQAFLRRTPGAEIPADFIPVISRITVPKLRWVFLPLIGVMAVICLFKGTGTQFRRRMDLEGLIREQAKCFPAIYPFIKFNPQTLPFRAPGQPVPAQLPLFAEALSPEEWLSYHEISYQGGRLDREKAYQALLQQLGRSWRGPEKLPIHGQGVFAACALKALRKRKESEALLDDMSRAWTPEKGFQPPAKLRQRIRQVMNDPKIGGALRKIADRHAWETTALLGCLAHARAEGGVLAPSRFLWLRGHDRTLWYPINNLGRKAYHAEAAGAMVHYTNELIAGTKIPTPRFDGVIREIEAYMKSGMGRSIPQRAA